MKSIKEANVRGKRVLVRVDFNVPLKDGTIEDDTRIKACLPLITYLRKKNAKIILISHLGRPDGKVVDSLRLQPIANHLSKLLNYPVHYEPDCIGNDVEESVRGLHEGDVLLLENLRFYPEEEANDERFAQKLASIADIYVNDAFADSHRNHASIVAITRYLPSFAGPLLEQEVRMLSHLLEKPKHPFIAIMGGAKVSDKIGVITNLLSKVDAILIGGAMAFTFYKALGYETGKSLCEPNKTPLAKKLLRSKKIILPTDIIAAKNPNTHAKTVPAQHIPKTLIGLDIGPETQHIYAAIIANAKTIFWNGPLGLFEKKAFATGTKTIATAIAKNKGTKVAGGGDSLAAIEHLKLQKKFTHLCTGGGAALEFLEGKKLPGIEALHTN